MGVVAAKDWLVDLANDLTAIQKSGIPNQNNVSFPFAVVYPTRGDYSNGTHGNHSSIGDHNMTVEIHYQAENVRENMDDAIAIIDLFMMAFRAKPESGAVHTISNPSYTFGGLPNYGGIATYGPTFTLTITSEDG